MARGRAIRLGDLDGRMLSEGLLALSSPTDKGAKFTTGGGDRLALDATSPLFENWNRLVEESSRSKSLVYVEAAEGVVQRLLPSYERMLLGIDMAGKSRAELTFAVTNAALHIDLESEGSREMLETAQQALHEGRLVEFVMEPATGKVLALEAAGLAAVPMPDTTESFAEPTKGLPDDPVDRATADRLFQQCASLSYVPFVYPVDCCAFRAWEMRRLLLRKGFNCNKIFHYPKMWLEAGTVKTSRLVAPTANHPDGKVEWVYHVAPEIYLREGGSVKPMVIDPSLFPRLVERQEWIDEQPEKSGEDAARSYAVTPGRVHFRTAPPWAPYRPGPGDEGRWDFSPLNGVQAAPSPTPDEQSYVRETFHKHYAAKVDLHMRPGG